MHDRFRPAPLAALLLALTPGLSGCGPGDGPSPGGSDPAIPALVHLSSGEVTPEDVLARPSFHDFGGVPDGDSVEHVFRMENRSQETIAIARVSPSCGCTVPTVRYRLPGGETVQGASIRSGDPILLEVPPGAIFELVFAVDTAHIRIKNADKLLFVNVTTEDEAQLYLKFEAHIKVLAPFFITPNGINLSSVPKSTGGTGTCEITAAPGSDLALNGVIFAPDDLEITLTERTAIMGVNRRLWRLEVELLPPLKLGQITRHVEIATVDPEGKPGRPLKIGVSAFAREDVVSDPTRLVLVVPADSKQRATTDVVLMSLIPGHRYGVLGLHLQDGHPEGLEVTAEPVDLNNPSAAFSDGVPSKYETWLVRLSATRPLAAGSSLHGTVTVELDDSQTPEVEVPYVIHVR